MLLDLFCIYVLGLLVFLLIGCYIYIRYKTEYACEIKSIASTLDSLEQQQVSNRFYNGYMRYALIWPIFLLVKMVKFTLHLFKE